MGADTRNQKHLTSVLNALALINEYKFKELYVVHDNNISTKVYVKYNSIVGGIQCNFFINRFSEIAKINNIKLSVAYLSVLELVSKWNKHTEIIEETNTIDEEIRIKFHRAFDKIKDYVNYCNGNYYNICPAIIFDDNSMEMGIICAIPYLDDIDFGIEIYNHYISVMIQLMDMLLLNISITSDNKATFYSGSFIEYPNILKYNDIDDCVITPHTVVHKQIYKYMKSGINKVKLKKDINYFGIEYRKKVPDRLYRAILLNLWNLKHTFRYIKEISLFDGAKLVKKDSTDEIILQLDSEYFARINCNSTSEICGKEFKIGKLRNDKINLNSQYKFNDTLVIEITDYSIDLDKLLRG